MSLPKQTARIFESLSKGNFVNSNSSDLEQRELYEIVDQYFDDLKEHFSFINFILERGDEYFYFSRSEAKVDLERKLEAAYKWIDIIDFFKTYTNSFAPGFRFSPAAIAEQCKVDAVLKMKLEGLRRHANEEKFLERIRSITEQLRRQGFVEMENEILDSWKVLASFHYLENLILMIDIPEETANEIPE